MTIEKAISRLIEFYNKAKKERKKYPVAWAVHKTDEWLHHIVKITERMLSRNEL